MKFYLVRHGETEWNKLGRFQGHEDIKLNERGLAQARETAKTAAGWGHSAIYTSPLTRTVQVAEELAKVTPVPVSRNPICILPFATSHGIQQHRVHDISEILPACRQVRALRRL